MRQASPHTYPRFPYLQDARILSVSEIPPFPTERPLRQEFPSFVQAESLTFVLEVERDSLFSSQPFPDAGRRNVPVGVEVGQVPSFSY